MPTPPGPLDTPDTLTQIASRLRAAGCVYAEEEACLLVAESAARDLQAMVEQRVAGVPLECVLGWAEFCGRRFQVERGVFVPRRRSEFLAAQAVELTRPGALVLDLCCGAGAVGAVLAGRVPRVRLVAADIDPVAVRCARRNLAPCDGQVFQGDLYAALPAALKGRIDTLVVNAPYVPSDRVAHLPREARLYEPRHALDGGPDGHGVQQRVAGEARQWLAPGGHLLMETSHAQAPRTAALLASAGLSVRVAASEEWDVCVAIGTPAREPRYSRA